MASKLDSLSERSSRRIASLGRRKYRERHEQCIVEGVRGVRSAVEAGAPVRELVVEDSVREDDEIARLIDRTDGSVSVSVCGSERFARLSDVENPQGVLAVVDTQYRELEDLASWERVLALDAVQDPGNAGTLLRTAAWFGVDCVIAGKGTVDLYNPKVLRAGTGAHWELALRTHTHLDRIVDRARTTGFASYAADVAGSSVSEWRPELPSMLVLGNEGRGVSSDILDRVDRRVRIRRPHLVDRVPGGVESLNVAVASGIILYRWLG